MNKVSFYVHHNLSPSERNQIAKDIHDLDIQPLYSRGETVFLKNEVIQDGYKISKYALCWVKQILIMLEKIEDKKNKDIIHFVFNDDFFCFQNKVYFYTKNKKNKIEVYNFDEISYEKLVCYGIKHHLLQEYGKYSHTWRGIFFYLLNNRFSSNVAFMLDKKNFFEKWKNEIFDGFIESFPLLKFSLQISTFSNLTAVQKQNLVDILLYLNIDQKKAENFISNLITKNDVSEIIQYLQQTQLSFQK